MQLYLPAFYHHYNSVAETEGSRNQLFCQMQILYGKYFWEKNRAAVMREVIFKGLDQMAPVLESCIKNFNEERNLCGRATQAHIEIDGCPPPNVT